MNQPLFAPTRPLDIVLLLRSGDLPAWVSTFAATLVTDGHRIKLAIDACCPADGSIHWRGYAPFLSQSLSARLYFRAVRYVDKRTGAAFEAASLEGICPPIGIDECKDWSAEVSCDLAIDLRFSPGDGDRFLVSSATTVDFVIGRDSAGTPCVPETRRGDPVVRCACRLLRSGSPAVEISHAHVPLHAFSLQGSLGRCLLRLPALALKSLRIMELGLVRDTGDSGADEPGSPAGRLRAPIARLAGRLLAHLFERAGKHFLWREPWLLSFFRSGSDEANAFVSGETRRISAPADRIWADPFILRKEEKTVVFFEEKPFGENGRLACFELAEDGGTSETRTILERPYHLSYPYVFEHENEFYMIPESRANHTIDLYRCADFPARWRFVMTLMEGIDAVDTSVVWRNDGWWLLTNTSAVEGESVNVELYVFRSATLFSAEWRPYPMNPVVADPRVARGAGRIFERDGRLYRPSQDCSTAYGVAVTINEIEALSDMEYRERPVVRIDPSRFRGLRALHTYNAVGGLTVMDGKIRRMRFSGLGSKRRL